MPPISTSNTNHKLLLVLNFPTSKSLFTKSHLTIVKESAKRTSSLLILLKFNFEYESSLTESGSNATGSSSSSSSTTTTTTINNTNQFTKVTPTSLWNPLQSILASTYGAVTKVFIEEDRPLDKVDIVIDQMRSLGICFSSNQGETIKFDVMDDEVSSLSKVEVEEVGVEVEESDRIIESYKGSLKGEYEVIAMGGTFDHLHAGHKILLTMAAFITSKRLIVGVSDTILLGTKKYPELLEPLSFRISQVKDFLDLIKPLIQHDVVALQDVYGPTAHDPEVTAIVVSDETRSGGEAVNKERRKKQLSILDIFIIPLISDKVEDVETSDTSNEKVGVKVEDKMGSTGIRKWISEH